MTDMGKSAAAITECLHISSVYCRGDVVWLVGEAARDWCLDWPVCRPQDVHLDSPRNKWTSGLACEQLN